VRDTLSILRHHLPQVTLSDIALGKYSLCGDFYKEEGYKGMNIIDKSLIDSTWYISGRRRFRHVKSPYFEPLDMDGHGTFINAIVAGMAQRETSSDVYEPLQTDPLNIALKQINVKSAKSRDESAYLFDGLCGIHYAIEKDAKVINVSWRALATEKSIRNFFMPTLELLYEKNILLVAAAGNDRMDLNLTMKAWPAALSDPVIAGKYSDNIITVGAWDIKKDTITDFSNYGESIVNIYAPGINIINHGLEKIGFGQGTSYAAPFITRIAGILIGIDTSKKTAGEIKSLIIKNARLIEQVKVKNYEGDTRQLYDVRVLDYKKTISSY
jgi:subtilisin family serine protease